MKCANCQEPALYLYDPKPLAPTAYCATHLPRFLRQPAKAGLLPVTEAFDALKKETFAALSPTPAEEPKPAPRRRKRAPKKTAESTPSETTESSSEMVKDGENPEA